MAARGVVVNIGQDARRSCKSRTMPARLDYRAGLELALSREAG